MEVYQQEILDGISDLIKATASIKIDAELKKNSPSKKTEEVAKASISATCSNPNQIDLYYLECILASIGWNGNDDVFDKFETWKARLSPVDKPFNFQHDGEDIIGHITGSSVIDREGNILDGDIELDDLPDDYDIYASSVIYKVWPTEEKTEQISELIKEIDEGKWFVSMECLFPNFDYSVMDTEGNQKIIKRTEDTSFLTKHLKAYGGDGKYKNYRVGRLLRNFTFSGKGLVNEPANPRSVVFNEVLTFNGSEASIQIFSETKGNKQMTDINVEQLQKTIAELKAENLQMKAKAEEEAKKSYEDTVANLETEISDIKAQLITKEATIAELQTAAQAAKSVAEAKEQELNSIKAEMIKVARSSKLAQAGLDQNEVEKVLAKFAGANDEMFDEIVTLHAEAKKAMCEKQAKCEQKTEAEQAAEDEAKAEVEAKAEAAKTPDEIKVVEEATAEITTNGDEAINRNKVGEIAKASMKKIFARLNANTK